MSERKKNAKLGVCCCCWLLIVDYKRKKCIKIVVCLSERFKRKFRVRKSFFSSFCCHLSGEEEEYLFAKLKIKTTFKMKGFDAEWMNEQVRYMWKVVERERKSNFPFFILTHTHTESSYAKNHPLLQGQISFILFLSIINHHREKKKSDHHYH